MNTFTLALQICGALAVICGALSLLPWSPSVRTVFARLGFFFGSFAKLQPPTPPTPTPDPAAPPAGGPQ